jgi:tetratricopeptide (TPR) repeat protein/tRNA A-37 threonylcarbamoyl transferase component Bud32
LRPHAAGGLGEVHVAEDCELHREVALKRIREEYADDPDSRHRFLREAEITGGLEHPGIVPVYGMGQYADGRPYYAMRFIKGDSLKQAIDGFHQAEGPKRDPGERTLALRELLGRFVAVCNAVAYAHSRGVVHRDLKPDNVMLGPYGETLVVDWGLAKPVGRPEGSKDTAEVSLRPTMPSASQPSQMGQVMGTPAYMAPEQAEGRLDQLGPASDVYSLGATLYRLLTGKAPFEKGDPRLVLQRVIRGEFPPLRQIKGSIPRPLSAICLKAMALKPEDRYASARGLADDIEHWLADEPVPALREPVLARLGRWCRRHRTLVRSAAAALVVLLVVGGVAAWWLGGLEAEWRAEEARAHKAVELALEQIKGLQRQARWEEAEAVLVQAESRLGQDGPAELRGLLAEARDNLRLVKRLDEIWLEAATIVDGKWNPEKAGPAYAVAFKEHGLDVLAGEEAELGRRLAASPVKEQLVAALEHCAGVATEAKTSGRLLALARRADPDAERNRFRDPAVWRDRHKLTRLARQANLKRLSPTVTLRLGEVLERMDGPGLEVLAQGQRRWPGDFWLNFDLANALNTKRRSRWEEAVGYYRAALAARPRTAVVYNNLGIALKAKGDLDAAIDQYNQAIALDPNYAAAHYTLGNALKAKGDLDGAIAHYKAAIAINPNYAAAHNNLGAILCAVKHDYAGAIPELKKAIAIDPNYAAAHNNLGFALEAKGDLKGAIAHYKAAIAIDAKYASAHTNLGNALMDQGDLAGAIAEYIKAAALDPADALAHYNLGNALYAIKDLDGAIAEWKQAIVLDPKYAKAHTNLGNALKAKGDLDGAIAQYRQAISIDPNDALAHYNFGLALKAKGHLDGAIAEYNKAIALDPEYAQAHTNLGYALEAKGDLKGAIAHYKKAIAINPNFALAHNNLGAILCDVKKDYKGAIAEFKEAIAIDPNCAAAHSNLGNALKAKGDLKGAIAHYKKAIAIDPKYASAHNNLGNALKGNGDLKGAIAHYKATIAIDPNYANAYNGLGLALYAKGDPDGAIAAYRKAIAIDRKDAQVHTNLGVALEAKGDLDGAIAEHKKAIALDPKYAKAHGALGRALLAMGRFTEARTATRKVLDLLPEGHSLRNYVTQQLRRCEQWLQLEAKLPTLLKPGAEPPDTTELLALAVLCQNYKKRYTGAARFYADAFAANAKLPNDLARHHPYNAARAAALAAAGKGEDAAKLEDQDRARLRKQALDWLQDDLAAWTKVAAKGSRQAKAAVRQQIEHWQKDGDLSGVRDKAALANLPKEEREAWTKLWKDVDALLKQVQAK